jgi:GntR family transcriptional regulator, transcriptional repressor for pyruvate dehydrogenase complex
VKASIAIAAELRTRIASGDLAPGDPLPVEGELTGELGCSKPVVREALRILETEGLVEVRRGVGGGARVCHPTISHAASGMGVHLQLGDVGVLDVWTARDRIVAEAVERLGRAGDAVDVEPLADAVDALAASVGDMAMFNAWMLEVGSVAVRTAGNATEHLLVSALRHIVEAEVTMAAARVGDADGLSLALTAERGIADAWARILRHVRAGQARAARRAYEQQADALRALVGVWIADLSVGEAATRSPH